jgi:hypothetical protein
MFTFVVEISLQFWRYAYTSAYVLNKVQCVLLTAYFAIMERWKVFWNCIQQLIPCFIHILNSTGMHVASRWQQCWS